MLSLFDVYGSGSSVSFIYQKVRHVIRSEPGKACRFQADILKANQVLYGILCGVSIFRRDRGLDVWRKEVFRLPAY